MKKNSSFVFWTKIFLLYAALIFMVMTAVTSCGSVKQAHRLANRAIKNPVAFEKVGKAYILENGCISDTTKIEYLPGKSDTVLLPGKTDTIPEKVPCDSFEVKQGGTTVKVNKQGQMTIRQDSAGFILTRVDTARFTVVDKTQLNICKDSLAFYRLQNALKDQQIKTLISERNEAIANENAQRSQKMFTLTMFGLLVALYVILRIKKILP